MRRRPASGWRRGPTVWSASTLTGRSWQARTFAVHGHHYALVEVDRLEPGSVSPYEVEIDGVSVWPDPDSEYPASVIATRTPGRRPRIAYGSCRTSVPHDRSGNRTHGVDSLRAFALAVADGREARPDLLLFLGDQVYADSTTKEMQAFIRSRRDIHEEPGKELKDFEEYAHLYQLAWSDEANRWLLSCVPTAMIFDDHDIRDDWNASLDWKRKMEATSWWHERIVAGLASYWVYQHLGNLSPRERAADELWQQVSRARRRRMTRPQCRAGRVRRPLRQGPEQLPLELLPRLRWTASDRRGLTRRERSDAVGSRAAERARARVVRRPYAGRIPPRSDRHLAPVPPAVGFAPRRGMG